MGRPRTRSRWGSGRENRAFPTGRDSSEDGDHQDSSEQVQKDIGGRARAHRGSGLAGLIGQRESEDEEQDEPSLPPPVKVKTEVNASPAEQGENRVDRGVCGFAQCPDQSLQSFRTQPWKKPFKPGAEKAAGFGLAEAIGAQLPDNDAPDQRRQPGAQPGSDGVALQRRKFLS